MVVDLTNSRTYIVEVKANTSNDNAVQRAADREIVRKKGPSWTSWILRFDVGNGYWVDPIRQPDSAHWF